MKPEQDKAADQAALLHCLDCGKPGEHFPFVDTNREDGPICRDCYERWKEANDE